MMAQNNKVTSALNNAGLPDIADLCYNKTITNTLQLSKKEMQRIKTLIIDWDSYYKSGWQGSNTRQLLVDIVNEYATIYRSYSLIIQ